MMWCFWFHKWEPWVGVDEGKICNTAGNVIGRFFIQKRVCKRCGFTDYNTKRLIHWL